ncbi:MAG: zf-HC2 domain-containing protein [Spirochaetes bacterium]|nr:zf-HC2 domain-containing protein [Spirochaetota bacterium]
MDCSEIKKFLDKYLDNELSKDGSAIIKKHISSCRECAAELAFLKQYRKDMASLNGVKAPADFLQQLNLRIDKQSSIKKIIRTLFFPLKSKLPVEALGVLVIGVLVVLFVNPAGQIKESIHVDNETAFRAKTARVEEQKIAGSGTSAGKTAVPAVSLPVNIGDERMPAKLVEKSPGDMGGAVKTHEIMLALYQAKSAQVPRALKRMASPESIQQHAEESTYDAAEKPRDVYAGAAPEREEPADSFMSGQLAEAKKEARISGADASQEQDAVKEKDDIVDRQAAIAHHVRDIRETVAGLNGRVIKEELNTDGQVKYIIVDMPHQNHKEFISSLSRLGDMQLKDAKQADKAASGIIRFRITITRME